MLVRSPENGIHQNQPSSKMYRRINPSSRPSHAGAFEVGEEGDLAQSRDGSRTAHVARGEEAVAAAGIDHEAGAKGSRLANLHGSPGSRPVRRTRPGPLRRAEAGLTPASLAAFSSRIWSNSDRCTSSCRAATLALAEIEAVFEIGLPGRGKAAPNLMRNP